MIKIGQKAKIRCTNFTRRLGVCDDMTNSIGKIGLIVEIRDDEKKKDCVVKLSVLSHGEYNWDIRDLDLIESKLGKIKEQILEEIK